MARLSVRGRRYPLVLGTCAVTPYHVLVYRVLPGAGGYAVSTQAGRRGERALRARGGAVTIARTWPVCLLA